MPRNGIRHRFRRAVVVHHDEGENVMVIDLNVVARVVMPGAFIHAPRSLAYLHVAYRHADSEPGLPAGRAAHDDMERFSRTKDVVPQIVSDRIDRRFRRTMRVSAFSRGNSGAWPIRRIDEDGSRPVVPLDLGAQSFADEAQRHHGAARDGHGGHVEGYLAPVDGCGAAADG